MNKTDHTTKRKKQRSRSHDVVELGLVPANRTTKEARDRVEKVDRVLEGAANRDHESVKHDTQSKIAKLNMEIAGLGKRIDRPLTNVFYWIVGLVFLNITTLALILLID